MSSSSQRNRPSAGHSKATRTGTIVATYARKNTCATSQRTCSFESGWTRGGAGSRPKQHRSPRRRADGLSFAASRSRTILTSSMGLSKSPTSDRSRSM